VDSLRVIITGGGTGGHLYPALAILEELKKRASCDVLFVGTRRGLEAAAVPRMGIPFKTVWISGLKRGRFWTNIFFPLKMAVSFVQSLRIVGRFRPDVAVGTGGYASWPVLEAARVLGKKTVIQEQNEKPGLVTRVLSAHMNSVHLSYESSKRFFRKPSNLHVSGNPTRRAIEGVKREDACRSFQLDPDKKTLFVFGGSQGAKRLNAAVLEDLEPLLLEPQVQILWATGPNWIDGVRKSAGAHAGRVRALPYIDDMGSAYAAADLVLCRSGAGTAAEIARLGKCAVFVPFPGAAGGHQEANAKVMADAGAAIMIRESELTKGTLKDTVLPLLADSGKMKDMAVKAGRFARPEAAGTIAADILRTAGKGRA
jgi:UDP-N-acetylglucosamine--N-acetylmuramyl-(pentapeptide) pyrophosphoryl-undecaprenol N-acetylglucosamine transferase